MDSIALQDKIKVEQAPSKANRTAKNKKSSRKSSKAAPKGEATAVTSTETQQKSSKKPFNKTVTLPSQTKNTPRTSSRPSSKKSNSPHRKSSTSANSNSSTSAEDDVPPLMYGSSGTDSDDSDHFDTQLSYNMYSLNINRCVFDINHVICLLVPPWLMNKCTYSQKNQTSVNRHYHQQKVTVAKQDVKYAGPTFSNAPAPNQLPLPGFNRTPKVATDIELQRKSYDLFNLLVPSPQHQPFTPPMNNVYSHPSVPQMNPERALTLNEIQQGLRAVLKIQA
ncbi:hypothetical protein BGW37DRAFT_506113 [Umbelopsis sp. PMI_123]|nr:hypothetical protein BGW37DRAFT_506113 [Umbelopsis sp. PMI_123]